MFEKPKDFSAQGLAGVGSYLPSQFPETETPVKTEESQGYEPDFGSLVRFAPPWVKIKFLTDLLADQEITPEIERVWHHLIEQVGNETDFNVMLLKYLEQASETFRSDAAKATDKARRLEAHHDRVKSRLKSSMVSARTFHLSGNEYEIDLKKSKPKLVIDNEAELLKNFEFQKTVTKTVLDKDMVLAALLTQPQCKMEHAHLEDVYALTPKRKIPEIDVGKGSKK